MNYEPHENLEDLIAEEKRLIAEEHLLEAWEAGLVDGIENEIIATAFAKSVLKRLAKVNGTDAVARLLNELTLMNDTGDFIPGKTIQ